MISIMQELNRTRVIAHAVTEWEHGWRTRERMLEQIDEFLNVLWEPCTLQYGEFEL